MTIRTDSISTEDGLARARDLVRPALRDALQRLDTATREVCGYHLGFWDADGTPRAGAGKGVRPALAILSARAAGSDAAVGVPAAVACELVHNFSLLHDDIMDRDTERRHRRTAWALYGESRAILAGDALQSLASELLAEAPSPTSAWAVRCLNAATRRLIAGQAADLAFETRDDVSLDECLAMAAAKTGALMACSASLGAVLADAPSELAMGLTDYGTHIGLAFQLVDDLLGIWGTPERTGKPVLSDLRSRKKSVPVVAAFDAGGPAAEALRSLYALDREMTAAELIEAAELVTDAGGRAWTEKAADRELAAALECLEPLDMPPDVREQFVVLARQLSGRDE
ncbi:geranylgeranyl diphosphate synthase type I [Antricoccus suffuscus]|uniref:Geranylgeranyl diphosphate synthase type I n=1 Tax=Antricoccus suffuscus TaxID=1629062 RepID=A0A2T0ZXK4_9ACTN|nr:polyprenyl synthetase family protein [Antricoccus suffuscus]PRZ41086.1 geranylgeranyl diphosphate synthase type I [Antricoccus suffuscus]